MMVAAAPFRSRKNLTLPAPEITCWTMIDAASQGLRLEREQFARRYQVPVRAYLTNCWRGSPMFQFVDDAVQEVFLECFRDDGPLSRVDRNRAGGFRPYLYGVVRNVSRGMERRQKGGAPRQNENQIDLDGVASEETALSQVFDRAWSQSVMQQAAERQAELARIAGDEAVRRVELLRLRFQEGLAVREIARRWNVEAADLHREQTKARHEFQAALMEVLAIHHPGSDAEVRHEAETLLSMLG